MSPSEFALLAPLRGALPFAQSLAAAALLAGCFADEGFGLDTDLDTDGDDESAAIEPCEGARGCVPLTPQGWSGPVARWQGPTASAPACPASLPIEWARFGDAAEASPVECACSCDSDVACDPPRLELYPFSDCQGVASLDTAIAPGQCQALGSLSGSGAKASGAPPQLPGAPPPTCTPETHELDRPTPKWHELTLLCGAADTQGQCGELGQCMPHAQAPMLGGSCLFRPGEHTCPGGPWTVREVVYESFDDERTCSACSCGAVDPEACAATIELFTDDECTMPHPATSVGTGCQAMQGYAPRSARLVGDQAEGTLSCAPSGGEAEGEVIAVDAVTLCCTP